MNTQIGEFCKHRGISSHRHANTKKITLTDLAACSGDLVGAEGGMGAYGDGRGTPCQAAAGLHIW